MVETAIDLGFVEDCEPWLLTNKFFPSKVGGKPAWLDLKNIPKPKDLECPRCKEPMVFLCQLYASSDKEHCFHRTVYVFICRNGACYQPNDASTVRVFRNQLPLKNDFYSETPPDENEESEAVESPVKLCRICGCSAFACCSKCKKEFYCNVSHQKADWKARHRQECMEGKKVENFQNEILFPEFELVIESEILEEKKKETPEEAEARRLAEYENLVKNGQVQTMGDVPAAEMEKYVGETEEDKVFAAFRERISQNKEQVVRYDRGGKPLWITGDLQLAPEDVPKCENCNETRDFEFQIMPQLLNNLKREELDWGVIAVFTCSKDCDIGERYVKEFAYKQDIVKDDEGEKENIDE
ncbi:programmed cell death protein 2 [Culicoides brevitarsis]|uniref:programmed cell death protein 2 n=1 Tax=Culicoides brevitarsis TaxID=469753 RepID=UPI00307CB67E